MSAAPLLSLRGLGHRFGDTRVLRGLDLDVPAGQRLALIGPNGAGKSTLFQIVSGALAPSEGRVLLQGQDITGSPAHRIHRLGLGRSFQISQLFARMSVLDHLLCAGLWRDGHGHRLWRLLSRQRHSQARAEALMERLGLAARRDVPAAALSYAEQRALEIGVALAGEPTVLLLDEPTAGMSHSETAHFVPLLRELTEGRTLLVVEHDMGVVFELADRVAVLVRGELLACDTPAAVRAHPGVQAAYLGQLVQTAPAGAGEGGHA